MHANFFSPVSRLFELSRLGSVIFCLALAVFATTAPWTGNAAKAQQSGAVPGGALGMTNDSQLWRDLRHGAPGVVSLPDKRYAVLIQSEGEAWRSLRNGPISTWGSWLLLASVAGTAIYFGLRRQVKIPGGRSGKTLSRFNNTERVIHWYVASTFILMAVSGLIILYGRYVLTPLIGAEAFSVIASASLQGHNLFGPLFIVGIFCMGLVYLKDNLLTVADLVWLKRGGGLFGGHAPSWKYNFVEKGWFWLAVILGGVLSLSGLLMEFPSYFTDRWDFQVANIFHAIAAIIVVTVAIGHIYLGLWGVEGALEGMTAGQVDVNWAKEHHSLWAEAELAKAGEGDEPGEELAVIVTPSTDT